MASEGRDKVAALTRLVWLRDLRQRLSLNLEVTETDRYKVGVPADEFTISAIRQKIAELEKEIGK